MPARGWHARSPPGRPVRERSLAGGAPNARETVVIHGGALDGVSAKLALPPAGVPHLWAFHDGLMITVAGDLTREQLLEVASSLGPMR